MEITLTQYSVAGLTALFAVCAALLVSAVWRPRAREEARAPQAWRSYRIGYPVYALIFLAFDMEMIYMYPWAVVFAEKGMMAFLDMLFFIAILSAGIIYAWGMGGFTWE